MQIAYGAQPFQIQPAVPNQAVGGYHGREPVGAAPANPFRLHVHNVPQYLSLDEFRNQFMKLEGCVNASVEKSETGMILGHYVDFVSQDFADKCASTFSNWKGWGPKGLAFQRVGHLAAEMKRAADGDAYLPAKHARMAGRDEPPQKQDGLSSLMQLASGAHYQMNSSGPPQGAMQASQERSNGVAPPGMYQRAPAGAYNGPTGVASGGSAGRMPQQAAASSQPQQLQTMVQPSMQGSMQQGVPQAGMVQSGMQPSQLQAPPQAFQQQPQTISQFATPAQQASQQTRPQSMTAPVQTVNAVPTQPGPAAQQPQTQSYGGQQSPSPNSSQISLASANVQYIQLADGTIRAMVPVQGEVPRGAQIEGVSQEPQPAPALQPAPQTTAPAYPSTLNAAPSEFPSQYSNPATREQPAEFTQMHTQPDVRAPGLPDPALALEPAVGGRELPLEGSPVPEGAALPADATETLYVEDVPTDMSKRELSHIFRPFGGFKEVRIVNKTKEDKAFSFAFAEFETAECSAAALSCLHGYQFDPDNVDLGVMHLRYARGSSGKNNSTNNNRGNQVHQDAKPMRQANHHSPNVRKAPMLQQPSQAPVQRVGGGQQQQQGWAAVAGQRMPGGGGNRGPGGRNQGGRHGGGQPRNNGWRGRQ